MGLSLGKAGSGGVLRGDSGNWIVGFGRYLGVTHSLLATIWALREGPLLASSCGYRDIVVEFDAKAIVDLLVCEDNEKIRLMPILFDCRVSCRSFRSKGADPAYFP